ncbi:hypothetical protein [Paenibacillus popilliae]|uniref:Uncharacterized protein n=1 Tax=Paenibacillus popilliae ATCC 14706 TaxID=1212764 RepID=M9M2R1_PAEPP|nr:hypothetical protein [Paenibacillus popilliae]GAC43254.1 hypothetical protein PPOP_2621 [Paenibacillus popilliae ATCC 14706]
MPGMGAIFRIQVPNGEGSTGRSFRVGIDRENTPYTERYVRVVEEVGG